MPNRLKITHFKVLHTVKSLNDLGYYPLPDGIVKILNGELDEETLPFAELPTFGSIISYGSKKINRFILILKRYGFIAYILEKESEQLCFKITKKGLDELESFLKKRKKPYKKFAKKFKKTIYKI